MSFRWPWLLPALALVPVAVGAYVFLERRRRKYAVRFASLSLLRDVVPKHSRLRRHLPFALLLDDATRCILPNGFDFGGGSDGRMPVYGCGQATWSSGVVVAPGTDPAAAINRSRPVWTVIVGQLGPPNTPMGFVAEHSVTTAWFAGN